MAEKKCCWWVIAGIIALVYAISQGPAMEQKMAATEWGTLGFGIVMIILLII